MNKESSVFESSSKTLGRKPSLIVVDGSDSDIIALENDTESTSRSHSRYIENINSFPKQKCQIIRNEEVERELAEYKLEIEDKFKKSLMNRFYKFPRTAKAQPKVYNYQNESEVYSLPKELIKLVDSKLFVKNKKQINKNISKNGRESALLVNQNKSSFSTYCKDGDFRI